MTGTVASVLSSAVLTLAGRRQAGSGAAPTNATSQWLWGRQARQVDRMDGRHTAAGYAIHHLASTFWALLHARAVHGRGFAAQPVPAAAAAATTAALAAFVDMRLTPDRLTPGFEHRLDRTALVGAYAAFALGLAVASVALHRRGR